MHFFFVAGEFVCKLSFIIMSSLQAGLKTDRQPDSMKTSPPTGHPPYYIEQLMAAHPYNAL